MDFLLVRLDVPRRIGANEDVVCHPAHDGMPAVRYFLFQRQLHQLLGRRAHILKALTVKAIPSLPYEIFGVL